jgi:hypothetical protein
MKSFAKRQRVSGSRDGAYLDHARSQVDAVGIFQKAHLSYQTLEPV